MTLKPTGIRAMQLDERLIESQRRQQAAYEYALARGGVVTMAELGRQFGIHYDRARSVLTRARLALAPDLEQKKRPPTPKRRFLAVIGDRMIHPTAIRPGDRIDRFTVEVM